LASVAEEELEDGEGDLIEPFGRNLRIRVLHESLFFKGQSWTPPYKNDI
jgi:hypothetical protein